MGCGGSKVNKAVKPESSVAEDWKTMHSMCRWNKEWDKIERTLEKVPESINFLDPKTGNTPLHITCQNGHEELTKILIDAGANVNAKNGKGQTALHMAMSYDYYRVVSMLLEGGADKEQKNDDGIPAIKGLEGDKTVGLVAFSSCENGEDIDEAFTLIEGELENTDKVEFIKSGLALKKRFEYTDPPIWTEIEQERFKAILGKLS